MCTDVIASHWRHIETDELASTGQEETDICQNKTGSYIFICQYGVTKNTKALGDTRMRPADMMSFSFINNYQCSGGRRCKALDAY